MTPGTSALSATAVVAALLLAAPQAAAFCTEPRLFAEAPRPASIARPIPPPCLDRFASPQPSCDEWELGQYDRQVEAYLSEVQRFAVRARWFAEGAADFARQADSYADCEARELRRW